jgi:hypothetical protein
MGMSQTEFGPEPYGTYPTQQHPTAQSYYVRDMQPWAIDQERMRHYQALWTLGEYAMFVLMWHARDHEQGLVGRCTKCYAQGDSVKSKIAQAYNQPEEHRCPVCFGTTFQGGFKAKIIRPAIFSDADEDEEKQPRGVTNPQDLSVESTIDFRVRSGDYVFRATGDRFQLRVPERITLRTGFEVPHQSTMAIGYNHARANQEDETSVAFIIPPTAKALGDILTRGSRTPENFSRYEIIRSPLIPRNDD